ncbi:MAG: hypothetical protein ACE37F_24130 [Nannocystaceae bacterium]|nr:hypothetical protein [bacterium]
MPTRKSHGRSIHRVRMTLLATWLGLVFAGCGASEPPPRPPTKVAEDSTPSKLDAVGGLRQTYGAEGASERDVERATDAVRNRLDEAGLAGVRAYSLDRKSIVVDIPAGVDPSAVRALVVDGSPLELELQVESLFGPSRPPG